MDKVFISHSTEDREFVEREIVPLLRSRKIETWYSPQAIRTAEEWERSIRKGLDSCDSFLVVMSPRSANSEWVRAEVFWAVQKRPGRIIPVLLETCDPTDFHLMLFQIQGVDFRRDLGEARRKLVEVFAVEREKQSSSTEAKSDYSRLMPSSPEEVFPLFNLGFGYYRKGEYDRAIDEFTAAIQISPNYVAAYTMRGVSYAGKQQYDEAITDFTTAIGLNPSDALAALTYTKRGIAYARKKEYSKGISDYTEAIKLNPTYADAYINRGATYSFNSEDDKALIDFSEAIRLDPKNTRAYINRAGVYRIMGELDEAKADYAKAIQLDPAVAKQIPEYFVKAGNDTISVRLEEAWRSVRALAPLTQLDKLSPQGRVQALKNLASIGWPKVLADLEYLNENLPRGNPQREVVQELLEIVRKLGINN